MKNTLDFIILGIFMEVKIHTVVFWVMTPGSWWVGISIMEEHTASIFTQAVLKHWYPPTRLHM
jgi:hypothetical protein